MRTLLVTAGRGPLEVRRFVTALGPALAGELRRRGLDVSGLEASRGSIRIRFTGEAPLGDLLGTHVLVAAMRGRRSRRRWFAGVTLHEEHETLAAFDAADVEITATRAGGPGGQHVNTTASAVRAVHRPTGVAIRVATERSQHHNRKLALLRLAERLAELQRGRQADTRQRQWRSHDRVQRGDPVATWHPTRNGGLQCEMISSRS